MRRPFTSVFCALLLVGLLSLSCVSFAQETAAPSQDSPQATIRKFFEAMTAYEAGNEGRILEAIECLYLDEKLTKDERLDQGSQYALNLYQILSSIQFKIADLPEKINDDDYTAQLGPEKKRVRLRLHLYEDKQWRFSSTTVNDKALSALTKAVVESEGAAEEEEAASAVYIENLKSPRATMTTFLKGMNETDGMTREDALATLDLSHINSSVRASVGMELALQLKFVLDRYKRVELSELPPESERQAFTYMRDEQGRIVLDVVEEKGYKSWKFDKATLDSVDALYLKFRGQDAVAGVKDISHDLSYALRLRDWMYDTWPFLLNETFYLQNWQWFGLLLIIIFGMTVSRIVSLILIIVVRRMFHRERFQLDAKLEKEFVRPIRISLMAWFWLLGLAVLGLPPSVLYYLHIAALAITVVGAIWAVYRLIDIVGKFMNEKAQRTANKFDDLLVPIVTRSLKIFVIVIGVVIIADNAGQDPSKLLAGLGLGGLAFALAAKDVVANIFGSITILIDRPFQLGDWVTIDGLDGNVEAVGIRSTRLRTFYNSLITIPNSELVNKCVDNMGARRYRRIKTYVSITYDTPPEKIDAFCEGIRELIREHPYTRKDYFHCYLNQFGSASLDILLYCFVETPDWSTELRERHRLFADIVRLAKRLEVEFAFPTQTLYMRQPEAQPSEDLYTPTSGMYKGRREAKAIVREYLGDSGMKPPPVSFNAPMDEDYPIDDRQIGEAGE